MQLIAHLMYQLNQWKIAVLLALTFGPVLVTILLIALNRDPKKESRMIAWGLGCVFGIGFPLIFGFAFLGSTIATNLVYHYGVTGEAIVTGRFGTGAMYNDEPVEGYRVLIRTGQGDTVETGFQSDSFNVYPTSNEVTYPSSGVTFTVRYLPDYPKDFVIISNDDSPWARSMRCYRLNERAQELKAMREFASNKDQDFNRRYEEALADARADGCSVP